MVRAFSVGFRVEGSGFREFLRVWSRFDGSFRKLGYLILGSL